LATSAGTRMTVSPLLALLLSTTIVALPALADEARIPTAQTAKAPVPPQDKKALGDDMIGVLKKAGFTDLQIMPDSVFVRAKDKAGNPVAMVLNPGSMTEIVTIDPHSGSAAAGTGNPGKPDTIKPNTVMTGSGTFTTVLATEKLASTLVGLTVRTAAGTDLGTIKDLAIDHGGVQAYILAVGGILGLGDRYVAVTPSAIAITYDQVANTYSAAMDATVDQLKAAPAFTYEGAFKARRD
jgi:sporulation protein YlmC with PRC-barrel domain